MAYSHLYYVYITLKMQNMHFEHFIIAILTLSFPGATKVRHLRKNAYIGHYRAFSLHSKCPRLCIG